MKPMHATSNLEDALIILAAATLFVPVSHRLGVSSVLGYLAAGFLVGPGGFGFISEPEHTAFLAEFGVVFLLFTVGLDLPLSRLWAMRRHIFGLGLAQVAVTSAVIGAVAYLFGLAPEAAIVVGGALALSSTATVLQLLAERGEISNRHGRIGVAVLLFQDLAVVPLLALIPLLGNENGALLPALGLAGLKAVAALAIILVMGRIIVRPFYLVVAASRNTELFAATTLLLILATAWATERAGMSMALGAFMAGLLLAGSPYRHQIEADIKPVRGLFLGLFFMTVAMTLDVSLLHEYAVTILTIALSLLALKTMLNTGLGLLFGLGKPISLRVGLLLSQGGEFAFVILSAAAVTGLIASEPAQILIAAVVLTIASTPLFDFLGRRVAGAIEAREGSDVNRLAEEAGDLRDHVVIAGFGRVGQTIARLLHRHNRDYVAIDMNAHGVIDARQRGFNAFFGDAARLEVWRTAGIDHARSAVVTLDQPDTSEHTVAMLRTHFPDLTIIARAHDGEHQKRLLMAGATTVVQEAVEASMQLGATTLEAAGLDLDEVARTIDDFRRDDADRETS